MVKLVSSKLARYTEEALRETEVSTILREALGCGLGFDGRGVNIELE